MRRVFLRLISIASGAASLFFAWYTARLIWINLFDEGVAQHRQTGMYIGAIAFPVAAFLFGSLSHRCRKSSQATPENA